MSRYEFTKSPHWSSSSPMVVKIWREIHTHAIKHKGKAFTFDSLFHLDENYYRYNTGLFSNGWIIQAKNTSNDPLKSGYAYDKQKLIEQARQVLRPYIADCSFRTVVLEDSRTRTAKKGAIACTKTEHYARISVSGNISATIYDYYETEGNAFKNRVKSSQPTLLNSLVGRAYNIIHSKVKEMGPEKEISIYWSADNNRACCFSNFVAYREFGLVPLTTFAQCYGLFLAMVESIMPIAQTYGQVTVSAYPYKSGNEFGFSGHIKIKHIKGEHLCQW